MMEDGADFELLFVDVMFHGGWLIILLTCAFASGLVWSLAKCTNYRHLPKEMPV